MKIANEQQESKDENWLCSDCIVKLLYLFVALFFL